MSKKKLLLPFLISIIFFSGCTHNSFGNSNKSKQTEQGIASFYADSLHGRKTANGEIFDQNKLTAAHKTLPFNTNVKVTNLNNNQSVIVRINDRGPFIKGRIIDLSKKAANEIHLTTKGIAPVKIEVINN